MSEQNPLIVDFGVLPADQDHPRYLDFDAQILEASVPFRSSSEIIPIIYTDNTYVFEQNQASNSWSIQHNLNKFPSVTIVDTAGTVVVGDVLYVDSNNIICTFAYPFSGTAYLN